MASLLLAGSLHTDKLYVLSIQVEDHEQKLHKLIKENDYRITSEDFGIENVEHAGLWQVDVEYDETENLWMGNAREATNYEVERFRDGESPF